MSNHEDIRKLAAAFKGNLMGIPHEIIATVHLEILEEEIYHPDPDLLACIDEAAEIIANAADQKEAEQKIKSLKGSQYTKNLACWLGGSIRHLELAEDVFCEMRKEENVSLFHVLQAAHARFKQKVGLSLLREIIAKVE